MLDRENFAVTKSADRRASLAPECSEERKSASTTSRPWSRSKPSRKAAISPEGTVYNLDTAERARIRLRRRAGTARSADKIFEAPAALRPHVHRRQRRMGGRSGRHGQGRLPRLLRNQRLAGAASDQLAPGLQRQHRRGRDFLTNPTRCTARARRPRRGSNCIRRAAKRLSEAYSTPSAPKTATTCCSRQVIPSAQSPETTGYTGRRERANSSLPHNPNPETSTPRR